MLEEELAAQRMMGRPDYTVCDRCGKAMPKSEATPVEADALEGTSQFAYLCRDCQAALANGERDLPLDLQ